MLRLLAYLGTIVVVTVLLGQLPWIGGWFRIPLLGFFTSAALVGFVGRTWAERALDRHRLAALKRQLGGVETPHNLGKLGTLLEARGRCRAAVPYFERASAGEPDSAEWAWRLGRCRLATGDVQGAIAALERAVELDAGTGYGAALLRLAEARRRAGAPEESLETVARAERNHGPNPQSAYLRGLALRALGRKPEAAAALREVSELARQAARYQRSANRAWVARALLARLLG